MRSDQSGLLESPLVDHDADGWVATPDQGSGTPYLVPLSFLWDGTTLLVATPASSPTGRNLQANGKVRLGNGMTRSVTLRGPRATRLIAGVVRRR